MSATKKSKATSKKGKATSKKGKPASKKGKPTSKKGKPTSKKPEPTSEKPESESKEGEAAARTQVAVEESAGGTERGETAARGRHPEPLERRGRVLIREEGTRVALRRPEKTSQSLLIITGAALVLVGTVDAILLWVPPLLGNAPWRLGTVSQTLDVAPATYLGLALLVYGIVRHPDTRPEAARAASIVFGALALMIIVVGVVYGTAVPSVLGETPDRAVGGLVRSLIAAAAELATLFAASVLIARLLWRSVEKT